jgi:hypothetical protein
MDDEKVRVLRSTSLQVVGALKFFDMQFECSEVGQFVILDEVTSSHALIGGCWFAFYFIYLKRSR